MSPQNDEPRVAPSSAAISALARLLRSVPDDSLPVVVPVGNGALPINPGFKPERGQKPLVAPAILAFMGKAGKW